MGTAMWTAYTLCEELISIQTLLDEENALEHLPQMVERYHLNLNVWMSSGRIGSINTDIGTLKQLRDLHWQTLDMLQLRQQRLRTRMQADRYGDHAARTYLSGSPP